VLPAADTVVFEPPLAAPGFVLVGSRSAVATTAYGGGAGLLRPHQSSTRAGSRYDRIRDEKH